MEPSFKALALFWKKLAFFSSIKIIPQNFECRTLSTLRYFSLSS